MFLVALSKIIIFSLSCPPNFFYSPHTTCGTTCWNLVYFWIRLLYFINLLYLEEFFGLSQIWTASDSNNGINWVEKSYSCYWVHFGAFLGKWKEFLNIVFRKHDHEHVAKWFLNSKKSKQSLKITRFVKISWYHTWRLWKKLRRFRIICRVRRLQTEASSKKNQGVKKDLVRFGVKVTVELRFDFKTFCIGNRQHRLVHVKFL